MCESIKYSASEGRIFVKSKWCVAKYGKHVLNINPFLVRICQMNLCYTGMVHQTCLDLIPCVPRVNGTKIHGAGSHMEKPVLF